MEKKDIHNVEQQYNQALAAIRISTKITEQDKKRIEQFVDDCSIGKNSRKKVEKSRLRRYLQSLSWLSRQLEKPFLNITEKDAEKLYRDLQDDKIKKADGRTYTPNTKNEFIKTIKKFGKWIYKDKPEKYQRVFGWMHTFEEQQEIPALSKEEIDKLAKTSSIRDAALLMFMFDTGARAEELLNIRIDDLREEQIGKDTFFKVRIRFGTTKTKARTITIPLATPYIKNWLSMHPQGNDKSCFLFPITYDYLRKILYRKGKILSKRIYPHLLRHSSATYYCNRLNQYQLCYRYGWSMSSKQPQRYIDREGIEEEKTAEIIKYDETSKLRKENQLLKEDIQKLKESDKIVAEKLVNLLNFFKSNPRITKQLAKEKEMEEIFT
jgi:site-specific recombinase XerD